MFPEVVSTATSYYDRFLEYQDLLSGSDAPCSKIKDVWSSIFKEFVTPKNGWQALWILTVADAAKYKALHPTAVVVTVDNCDWNEMTVTVTVTALQDNIDLPSVLKVSVYGLYPIKNQDYNEDDLKVLASWFDKYRFFFKYLWYPWDSKNRVTITEWCEAHLEKRLQIQSDIMTDVLDEKLVRFYESLIDEARHLKSSLSQDVLNSSLSESQRVNQTKDMIHYVIKKKVLEIKLDFFEEPELRKYLVTVSQSYGSTYYNPGEQDAVFVWSGGSIPELTTYLNTASSFVNVPLKICSSLQEALHKSYAGNLIILPSGLHTLTSLKGLGSGSIIRGLGQPHDTNLVFDPSRVARSAILLESLVDLDLHYLTISRLEGIAVQVSKKTLKMTNCRVTCNNSKALRGIIVVSGGCLILENCEVVGFRIGIVVQSGGKAVLTNTRIGNCAGGIKVSDESELTLSNVEISKSSKFGLCVESTTQDTNAHITGDLDVLKNRGYRFSLDSVEFRDSEESDVIVTDNADRLENADLWGDLSNGTIAIDDDDDEDTTSDYSHTSLSI